MSCVWLQLWCRGSAHHGVVSPRPLPARRGLLCNTRRPAGTCSPNHTNALALTLRPAVLQDHADTTGAYAGNIVGAWDYHSGPQLIEATLPRLPLRIFHHGSEQDLGYNTIPAPANVTDGRLNNTVGDPGNWTDGHNNWLVAANRRR